MILVYVLAVIASFAMFGYVPVILVVFYTIRHPEPKKRPVNDVLSDAVAEGRLTMEGFETMMDEVHRSMPTLDAPYPMVRDE